MDKQLDIFEYITILDVSGAGSSTQASQPKPVASDNMEEKK